MQSKNELKLKNLTMKHLSKTAVALGLFASVASSDLLAQDKVKITGEVRPRTELRNGFKKPMRSAIDPAIFTEQRTRLNAMYSSDKFDATISLQDVRMWGAVSQIYKTDPSLSNVYEAYAKYKFSPKSGIAVGRMALNYDNSRFLGSLAWAQQARSHDLALYTVQDSSYKFHLGVAFNQDASTPEFAKLNSTFYTGVNNYKTMQFAWFHKDAGDYNFSLLALNNGVEHGVVDTSKVRFSQTWGFIGKKVKGDVKGTLELYAHTGEDAGGNQMDGYLAAASITFGQIKKAPLTIGADYLSGTPAGSSVNSAFSPMYGTNHKFYGLMDYFYVGNGHSNAGLFDAYLKTKFKVGDKSALVVHLHNFAATVDVADPTSTTGENLSSQLGQEIDLVYVVKLSKAVNFKLGYSQLFKTTTMDAIKGVYNATNLSDYNGWAWAMLTFKPTFYSK